MSAFYQFLRNRWHILAYLALNAIMGFHVSYNPQPASSSVGMKSAFKTYGDFSAISIPQTLTVFNNFTQSKTESIRLFNYTHCFPIRNASIRNSTENLRFFKK